jgi:hypothetical protein
MPAERRVSLPVDFFPALAGHESCLFPDLVLAVEKSVQVWGIPRTCPALLSWSQTWDEQQVETVPVLRQTVRLSEQGQRAAAQQDF